MEADFKAVKEWFDFFNEETHKLSENLTVEAVRAIFNRFESHALFLIKGSRGFQ